MTQLIAGLAASEEDILAERERVHRDFIERIKQDRLKLRRQDLCQQIRQAEEAGDHIRLNELKTQFNQLIKG